MRTDEIVCYPVVAGLSLGAFEQAPFPAAKVDEQRFRRPLEQYDRSAGGVGSYDPVTFVRTFEEGVDDALLAALVPLQGSGPASMSYHYAPGHQVVAAPFASFDGVLLTVQGPDADTSGKLATLTVQIAISGGQH